MTRERKIQVEIYRFSKNTNRKHEIWSGGLKQKLPIHSAAFLLIKTFVAIDCKYNNVGYEECLITLFLYSIPD